VLPTRPCLGLSLGALLASAALVPPTAAQQLYGSRGHYRASIVVPVSQQQAWRVLTRYEAMAGVMPDIKQARVISRSGRQIELAQTYQAAYTFGLPIKARLRLEETAPQQLTYSLISGERIRSLSGSWTITPVSGGIRLEHRIAIDPEVPGFLRATYYELSEENLLESLRVLKRLMLRS
jgi:Polyketide cyclase / dehydrase and lipid transport